jgi:hypothetical protein
MKAHAEDPMAARWGQFPGKPDRTFEMSGTRNEGGQITLDIYPTCSYCGSITPATALAVLKIPGTHYGGSDWKYGWPHKFYFDVPCEPYRRCMGSRTEHGELHEQWGESQSRNLKFYAVHLEDATPEEIEQWNAIAAPLLGIRYQLDDEGHLRWAAPSRGFQTWGYVGAVLTPGHHESGLDYASVAPKVPPHFLNLGGER